MLGRWSEKARLAQSVERLALNQVVVGSSPTVGASLLPRLTFQNKIYPTSRNLLFDQINLGDQIFWPWPILARLRRIEPKFGINPSIILID